MKKVLSISLGSKKRDHRVKTSICGQELLLERRGTDGDKDEAKKLFAELDGCYDVFGIGGMDLYVFSGNHRYKIRETQKIIQYAEKTPVVDGSGLKNTLERKVIADLSRQEIIDFSKKRVLIVSAVDRLGMAEALKKEGADLRIGDLLFVLGLPLVLKSLRSLEIFTRITAPLIVKLPLRFLYPTGKKQEENSSGWRYHRVYQQSEIIAGDFHLIKRFIPDQLKNKTIITNTVTEKDVELLQKKGLKTLITTTPELEGRSFGTNLMEAACVALAEKNDLPLENEYYFSLLEEINFKPRIEELN